MNKLDELLKEYCPDGVEYKAIKEVFTRLHGTPITAKKMKEIEDPNGNIKVFAGGKTAINAVEEDIPNANITSVPAVLVQSRGVIDFIYYEKPFTFKNEMWAYTAKDKISIKFLYYVLKNNVEYFRDVAGRMGSFPQISIQVTEKFQVPVPPLPVQEEIVRILDSFTELTTKLITELTAELAERKKQYEYYRNELLTPKKDTKFYKLGEISTIIRGASPRPIKKYITTDPDGVNWIKIGDVSPESKYIMSVKEKITKEGSKKSRIVHKGDFILSNSMSFGRPYILDIDGCIHDGWLSISNFKNKVTPDYLYHILLSSRVQSEMKKRASRGGSIKNLNADIVKEIKIPVPGVDTQNRITKVLDNFESICSDLNIGLPAEIEARQKQYEYYRDALLTFAETGDIIAQTDRTSLD